MGDTPPPSAIAEGIEPREGGWQRPLPATKGNQRLCRGPLHSTVCLGRRKLRGVGGGRRSQSR